MARTHRAAHAPAAANVLTVGSLFSGIGGIDLGLAMTGGFETRWFVEIDPWCRRVLAKHWPDVPCYEDVTTLHGRDVEPVDVLAGGFPCQPVSLAGQRRGQDDDRWLWPHVARLVGELRPRFVLLENVPGLLSRGFGGVLGDLAACGYDAEWDCIPASAVGAPHPRDRLWVVAYPDSSRRDWCAQRDIFTQAWIKAPLRHYADGLALAPGTVWQTEPPMERMAHGVPRQVDRLRGLGNAVVPQVVEHIGRMILAAATAGRGR